MSNLTDFFPSGGGGGLTPKFQEFNSSGTFTPSQALIDAGGYIEVFLVGGGQRGVTYTGYAYNSGKGGEAQFKKMYLTSTSSCSVTIGAGGINSNGAVGGNSVFNGSSAGGVDITSNGGDSGSSISPSWGSVSGSNDSSGSAGGGVYGYGAGGIGLGGGAGISGPKANSGQGSIYGTNAASGYCLIKWYE